MVLKESLIELMKKRSILRISIKDICELADVSRSTFYAHYKDQYVLLRQIEDETLAYFEDMLNKYADKQSKYEVTHMVEEMLRYIVNNSNSIQVLLSENGDTGFQKKFFKKFTYQQEELRKYFLVQNTDEIIREYYFIFVMNGSIALIQHWLKNGMNIPIPELAAMIIKIGR
jgi:AcrR family transcriptional regulator